MLAHPSKKVGKVWTHLEPKHMRLPFEKVQRCLSRSWRSLPFSPTHRSGRNEFGSGQICGWKFCMWADIDTIDYRTAYY